MRRHPVFALMLAAGIAACESRSTEPTIALIGGPSNQPSSTSALTISPSQITLSVGASGQLTASAATGQLGQLEWRSSNNNVVTVTGTGLVTAFGPGTATVTARLTSDTTQVGSATVLVTAP